MAVTFEVNIFDVLFLVKVGDPEMIRFLRPLKKCLGSCTGSISNFGV